MGGLSTLIRFELTSSIRFRSLDLCVSVCLLWPTSEFSGTQLRGLVVVLFILVDLDLVCFLVCVLKLKFVSHILVLYLTCERLHELEPFVQFAYMNIHVHVEDHIIEVLDINDISRTGGGYVNIPKFKILATHLGITTFFVSSPLSLYLCVTIFSILQIVKSFVAVSE